MVTKLVKRIYLVVHNGSCFYSFVVLNIIPQWRTVVNLIKNESDFKSLKIFNGYVNKDKTIPQYVAFKCGRLHIIFSLKKICNNYRLQPSLLKQKMDHDGISEDTWENKENEWLHYLKNDVLSTASSLVRYKKTWNI